MCSDTRLASCTDVHGPPESGKVVKKWSKVAFSAQKCLCMRRGICKGEQKWSKVTKSGQK